MSEKPWHDKARLSELYHDKEMSMSEIAEKLGCSSSTVDNWMKKLGVETRSVAEGSRLTHRVERAAFSTNQKGYERLKCSTNKEIVYLHRLLMVAEHGVEAVSGNHVHHINGVSWDNRPSNLELMVPGEHSLEHHEQRDQSTYPNGSDNGMAQLTQSQVNEIRELRRDGMTYEHIAEKFGVSAPHVYKICSGERWCSA